MRILWTIFGFLSLTSLVKAQTCEALFTFDGTPITIHFIDISTHAPNDPIVSWDWDFDDGSGSSQQNPTHTFPAADRYDVVLQITTQNGCQSEVEVRIEICDFDIEYTIGQCNSNNMIPVSMHIEDIYDNADEIDVILDGQSVPGSPFEIDGSNPVDITFLVPGNGLAHEINIQSTDIETCGRSIEFTTEDCSSDCFLGSLNVEFAGGTTHNVIVGDDFFSPQSVAIVLGDVVHFVWQGSGHSTTSDATSGPDAWNSGVIGAGSTFDVNIQNPGVHEYYCQPHGGPNGVGMSGQILSNCPGGATLPLTVNFNTTIANAAGYNVLWDNVPVPGSPFDYNGVGPQSVTINIAGDGLAHSLIVRDVADPTCDTDMTYNAPDCDQGGGVPVCSISGTVGNFGGCNNNNVTATLTVNVTNGGTGFNVSIDNGPNTFHSYTGSTTIVSITLPGNGANHTVKITDSVDPACTSTINVVTPNCNLPCDITNLTATAASGNGGPSGIVHTVNVADFQFNPDVINITSGDVVEWVWTGQIPHTTTSDATSGPNSWDSGLLNNGATYTSPLLAEGTHPYYCIPHGAPGGVGMAGTIFVLPPCNAEGETSVLVEFNIVSNGVQGFQVLVDGVVAGSFPYVGGSAQSATVLVPGDAQSHTITVRDVANQSCTESTTVTTPDCGGGGTPVCSITVAATIAGGCSNNTVPVSLDVNGTNNGASFIVTVDGNNAGTFSYSAPVVTINVPGDGAAHTIVVTDIDDPTCTASTSITTPNCSLPCSITNLTATASSGGGPSGIVHTVNVADFQFNPDVVNITVGDIVRWVWTGAIPHTSTSDATSGPNSWNSGLLNNGATYDSPLLAEGTHPYYCAPHGAPGGVGMAGTVFVLPPCNAQGETNVVVSFNIQSNGNSGFQVLVDGTVAGTFPYVGGSAQSATVLVPGDAQSHSITVRDVVNQSCSASTTVTTPDCGGGGTPVCSITVAATIAGGCSNNTVPVSLDVNGTNNGASFIVTVDGNNAGTFSYSAPVVTINVPGDGASHTIVVTDIDDPTCTASTSITTPNCSLPCSITNLTATASSGGGPSGIVHTVNVADFQFNPDVVNITVGDIVRWVWTGAIPHTSTSDAASGPNSWNSGLLNNGATYDSPLLAEGTHPYYCAPHGAPGGVGMAGTVFVLPPCNAQGETNVVVSFNIQSNGNSGFQVLVDGTVAGTFPYVGGSAQSATVLVPGDAQSHSITVRDVVNQSCSASTTVTTPDCGGGGTPVCSISVTATLAGGCTNNTVPVSLNVNANNNGASFIVTVDGNNAGTFSYTAPVVTINVPGDGAAHNIVVTDIDDPACTASTSITTPNCTLPCSITNLIASVSGGSGGPSGIEHTVNVEDFQFNPNVVNITVGDVVKWVWTGAIPHTSTSDIPGTPNSWDSGLLGNGAVYTSPVLEEGEHGYYCIPHGAPGGVGMAGTIHVLPPCNAFGQTTVQITFNATNGGNEGYSVFVNGNNAGSFAYVPGTAQTASVLVPGNGMSHTILVQDNLNQSCSAMTAVTTPDCSGGGNPECMISFNPAITGGCNNGQVAVALNVTGVNNSTSYNVTVDGQAAGNFNYSNQSAFVNITGNGQPHTIVITDSVDPACTATSSITTPDCNVPCSISITDISFGENISHTVQVQDFQYAPEEITINLGDTINFVWTGQIPHTVTSDSPNGPNAFNSGLLGQGATWQLIPSATGTFPYYCIPHGAPGGVGMAGVINVSSTCNGDIANGNLTINYTSTSGQGFIVTNNGTPVTGSPFAYSPTGSIMIPLAVIGDGASHTFVVSDAGNASCSAQQSIIVPSCSSSSCTLALTNVQVSSCSGNTVTLTVNFTSNQSNALYNVYKGDLKLNASPLSTDTGGNGTYSTMIVGSGGNANITVQFMENASCSATQNIAIPACGTLCLISDFVIGQGGGSHTVEVRDFDFSPASIDVLIGDTIHFVWTGVVPHTTTSDELTGPNSWNSGLLGQGATFDVVINESGSFEYYCQPHGGPNGLGMAGVINVTDTCDAETWLTNMSFNVTAGSPLGYNVFVDGVKINDTPLQYDNPIGFNSEIIGLPGDGTLHLVTIQDLETGFCAYTVPVMTSICGAGCTVVNLTANTGVNILHTVEVRDFDYAPRHITVGAGETIRFVWTGEIPHTVTSDALSGPEVFNSGLLGQGATYDLTINTPGVHPYFCIPHGGPGGIGMAGSITVLPACADNKQNVQVKFNVTNGSLYGFNVFVDGMLYGNNPQPYDDRRGANEINVPYPADNGQHIITIQDVENNICAASEFFTVGTCNADCELTGIDYFLGNGRRHEVLVRDFDYSPDSLQIEKGDTVHFIWTGVIPHTVTSDKVTGVDAFNSGLLGQGAAYDVVITEIGDHPYYCIPHGGPGGIGMAGNIRVVDACDDGKVFVDFRFFSEGVGTSYDVSNNTEVVINDRAYQTGGIQNFSLELFAQGQTHNIQVSDNGPDDCTVQLVLDSFDCNDPCFLVRSNFAYDINFANNNVSFTDKSKGNIVGWNWNFGDGNISNERNPVHQFAEAILYEVCLTITDANGCTESFCDKLRLGSDVCIAGFTYEQNGLEFLFRNSSDISGSGVSAIWSFGDSTNSTQYTDVTHTYALGLYEICLTVNANGCVNTYCEILDLTDACLELRSRYQANQDAGNVMQYNFVDQSTGPVGSRLWGFGDGQISTSQNPTHIYNNIGVYTVCLLILDNAGNCTDSDCKTLYVGTTSTDPNEMQMKKMVVMPNPVSSTSPEVSIGGFDLNDIGKEATILIHDMNGVRLDEQKVTLEPQNQFKVPDVPGMYYLQVVTERNRYGAMIIIQ